MKCPPTWSFIQIQRAYLTKGGRVEVADRIEEYHELGIDEFILSGYPHLIGA